ncbi:hypothetical protein SAMN06265379_102273 [Saccharicrinis carchari]|uniref:Uncharacterized protein n=1 Tax=Saccharicrinis carchari TaxID=1168039 RepID=A0A521C231_SACCC|nr:hypothetical protein [Saccharicrinis carchari]SMO52871.1 hypothetical protein SAMN06265379_102273 [Saccharicrinis carchari]
MYKKISLNWFKYHLVTFLDLIIAFHPFRKIGSRLPLVCIPNGGFITFVFSTVTALIIYVPVILFVVNAINTGILIPEFFIVFIFGVVFGSIFRYIQAEMVSRVDVDQHRLKLTYFGFFKKEVTIFKREELKQMVLIKEKYRNTKNYKVCVELNGGRQIMLELTIFRRRAHRILNKYKEALRLPVSDPSQKNIINDAHVTINN